MTDRAAFDAAIAWHLRREVMDADDWLRFVDWLEADPAHSAAYDVVSTADALRHDETPAPAPAPVLAPAPAPANDNAPGRWRRGWFGAGVAAAAVLAAVSTLRPVQERAIVAATPQTVRLADGSAVSLATGARLVIGAGDSRAVRLDDGRATFRVVHDATHPFAVRAGGWTVQDVGTVFTVTHMRGGLDIDVREGAIMLDPHGAALPLHAGEAVSIPRDGATPLRSVRGKNSRTFRFSGETLGTVAHVVGLALNADIRPTAEVARQPFIGVLRLTGRAADDIPHLAAMTGTRSINDGRTWTIASAR